jgi:hypothetical protein
MSLLDGAVRSGSAELIGVVLANFAVTFEEALDYWLAERTNARIERKLATLGEDERFENPDVIACFLEKILRQRITAPLSKTPC